MTPGAVRWESSEPCAEPKRASAPSERWAAGTERTWLPDWPNCSAVPAGPPARGRQHGGGPGHLPGLAQGGLTGKKKKKGGRVTPPKGR